MLESASSTRACVRPVTTTCAPAAAKPRAIARPMPAVEPVTMAWRLLKSIFMGFSSGG